MTTIRSIEFISDIVDAVKDEQEAQAIMLDEVLEIANIVQENAMTSNEHVIKLGESTNITNTTVNEISASTQSTADSIQTQTKMTHQIQQSIEDTVTISEEMVSYAEESNTSINSSLNAMVDLKEQSAEIAVTNMDVRESMIELKEKTRAVEEIAGIIAGIS